MGERIAGSFVSGGDSDRALRIHVASIEDGEELALFHGEATGHDFDSAATGTEVSEVALRCGDWGIKGSKGVANPGCFGRIPFHFALSAAVDVPFPAREIDASFSSAFEECFGDVANRDSDVIPWGVDRADGRACSGDDFAPDFRTASNRSFHRFQDNSPGTFADEGAIAGDVVRPRHFRRVVALAGERFRGDKMKCTEWLKTGSGRTGEHAIGGTAADGGDRFDDRCPAAGFTDGEGVAGPTQIIVDCDVASGHVGQVLQQPERVDLRASDGGPFGGIEVVAGIEARGHTIGVFFRAREDVVAAIDDPESVGVSVFWVAESRVVECQLASGHAHFDFAAHHLLVLFDVPLKVLLEWSKVADIPSKALGLSAESSGKGFEGQAIELRDAASLGGQILPKGIEVTSDGTDDTEAGNNNSLA